MMLLAGIELSDDALLALVIRLRQADLDDQADGIVHALMSMQTEVRLTHSDRVAILTVLDDPPAELDELRAVLLQADVARISDGLP